MADRIVVMHDGLVEQIGTPLELFDRPGNLFVAQFIGSPAMNVLAGTLRLEEGLAWVEAEGQRWPVCPPQAGQQGQAVHYGVRPGDVELAAEGAGIPARVVVVEPTGAETEMLVEVGSTRLTIVLHGRTRAQPDDKVFLRIDAGKAHLFDAADGRRMD